jgi:hypothetical protein
MGEPKFTKGPFSKPLPEVRKMQGDLPALIYIPIRPDVTVAVQMPWDLTTAEARKVKTVLVALAGPPRAIGPKAGGVDD